MAFSPQLGPQNESARDYLALQAQKAEIAKTHTRLMVHMKIAELPEQTVCVFIMVQNDMVNDDATVRAMVLHTVNAARAGIIANKQQMDVSYNTQTQRKIL